MQAKRTDEALQLLSVVVRADRIIAVVKLRADVPTHTSPALMERVKGAFPDLPRHACVNAKGPTFAHVMNHTSIPHLLEHMVIDLQASEYTRRVAENPNKVNGDPPLLKGVTKWTDESHGVAQVQVSMFDDLVALGALKEALARLNSMLDE